MSKEFEVGLALIANFTAQLMSTWTNIFPPTPKISPTQIKKLRQEVQTSSRSQKDKKLQPLDAWQRYLAEVQSLVATADPNQFLSWPFVKNSMFVGSEAYVIKELNELRVDYWVFWQKLIKKSSVGTPPFFFPQPSSTSNTIHLTYHLFRWLQQTSQKLSNLEVIVEFGGGFGELARICYQAGFKGTYIILDFPTFLALQKMYLTANQIPVREANQLRTHSKGVYFVADIAQLKKLLTSLKSKKEQLCVATWSLSESPLSIRKSFLSVVASAKYYLIAYHWHFEKINNRNFFRNWRQSKKNFIWTDLPIQHIPENSYLFGQKRRI